MQSLNTKIAAINITILFPLSMMVVLAGCSGFSSVKRETMPPASLQRLSDNELYIMGQTSPFMKVHMQNGKVYVLDSWNMSSNRQNIFGYGTLYDANREEIIPKQRGDRFQIGLDSVAIFETNVIKTSGTVAALTVFTGITAAITIYCIQNPKACFGSCPTFYIVDQDSLRPQAEGFSASIAPSLEASDIDALFNFDPSGQEIRLEMRNEALETHVVRYADLLLAPRPNGHRVFCDTNNRFWECNELFNPVSAQSSDGDILPFISKADGIERFSAADSSNLDSKETVELEFEHIPQQSYGLVIGCRQTLLSTYLLYQTFAYMGNQVGDWFAKIERHEIKQSQNPIQRLLGGIEVLVQNSYGDWQGVGNVNEYGPLAIDFHLLSLGNLSGESVRIRLRMTRGNWRIDYVALASLLQPVQVTRLHPYQVLKNAVMDDRIKTVLCDSMQMLTSLPGDRYTLIYQIPENISEYDLFLKSRGYYIEWIRKEWMDEENPFLLSQMFMTPHEALKRLAPEFKRVEAEMENCFWRSRYAVKKNE
jgi:hypothetical protein